MSISIKTTIVKKGDTPTPPENPIWEGYTFMGWSPDIEPATKETTYIAIWKSNSVTSYTITWNPNNGKWSDGSTSKKTTQVNAGSIPEMEETPTRDGYTFEGWEPAISTTTKDVEYKAKWKVVEATKYSITFNPNNGNWDGSTGNKTLSVEKGQKPQIADPTREGYAFKGWNPQLTVATKDTTYTAVWEMISQEDEYEHRDGDIAFKQLSVGYLPYNGMSLAELKQNLENQDTNWMGDPTGGGVAVQDDDLGYYGFNSDGTNECYAVAWYDVSFWYHDCGCHIAYVFVDGEIYNVRSTDTNELNVEDIPEEYWPEEPEFSWEIVAADDPPQIEISDGGVLTTTRVNNNTVGDVCRYTNSQGVEIWTHIQASINVYPPVTPVYFASVLQAPKS